MKYRIKKKNLHIIARIPLEIVSIEVLEKVRKLGTYEYVLSIVDIFTKFLIAFQ